VDEDHRFTGFEGGRRVIESDVDVVLLAEPPHFRPAHLRLALERGRHVFAEKPVAVDGPGVRSVLESTALAQEKGLSIVSGLCWRYDNQKKATIEQVLEGRIGDIVAMQCTYNTGALWHRGHEPDWSPMENQVRNWLYYTWLSGDHIAEQHIHSLDKMPWAMGGEYPEKCVGSGGRQVRTEPMWGNVYDHFNITYEWKNGVKAFASCRQWAGAASDVSDHIFGTKGRCHVFQHRCEGEDPWFYDGPGNNMYQSEHDVLFRSIREGKPVNNGDYMARSTLMAIMGRMAAYTGQTVTFEQALASEERLGPKAYAWGEGGDAAIAQPGITAFR
jgi:predicted dehydrogenase